MAYCRFCAGETVTDGVCSSLLCQAMRKSELLDVKKEPPKLYLTRLVERREKYYHDLHELERSISTLTALIQFLTERPDVQDVAEKVMEV